MKASVQRYPDGTHTVKLIGETTDEKIQLNVLRQEVQIVGATLRKPNLVDVVTLALAPKYAPEDDT